jgi:outer membrane biosynthesis protein TonB
VPSPPETEEQAPIPTASPTPNAEPTTPPPKPASAYRDFQQKTLIRGGINNRVARRERGRDSAGRYKKLLEDAIGSRWYYYTAAKVDLISIGTTAVKFEILADGSVANLRMTENTGNEASASIALRSIQETKFPPILKTSSPPAEGRFTMEESFTIFANR